METKTRYCGYCNKDIKGRSDKRFCDIQCKSAYHNSTTNPNEALIKDINKQLRRNRGALRQACPIGKATVRVYDLKGQTVYTEQIFCNTETLIKELSIGSQTAGNYMISVKSNDKETISKLLITK